MRKIEIGYDRAAGIFLFLSGSAHLQRHIAHDARTVLLSAGLAAMEFTARPPIHSGRARPVERGEREGAGVDERPPEGHVQSRSGPGASVAVVFFKDFVELLGDIVLGELCLLVGIVHEGDDVGKLSTG